MKYFWVATLFLVMGLTAGACNRAVSTGPMPNGVAAPTATPTPNLTPVCGFTAVPTPLGGGGALGNAGVYVLHNLTEWNNYIANTYQPIAFIGPTPTPTPVPIPPVNFATQMLIVAAVPEPCDNTTLTITSVCESPSLVTVNVTAADCTSCPQCNVASAYSMVTSAVAVPLSNQPVTVITTTVTY